MQSTDDPPAMGTALVSLNRIRVETALSRFPIHRLAKKDTVTIDLQQTAENGEADFKWEVTHNQKHGQPGPLAYKVDTLIVNRRIDESGRPLPGVIKLGSLTELCASLGIGDSGENRANLRKALHQNASAYITAKIRYRTKTGKDRWSEIGYTRYSVVFTGEMLPDGEVADAVYIIPNTSYRELLNHVEVRPLDYDYLLLLAPGPQRFYELLSFQVYGAMAGGRPRAKMLYSVYCNHAPQVRYRDFDRVKKQMYKIHAPHREAGYIAKVDYELTVDGEGAPDWEMFYTPGARAIAEFQAFTRRQVHRSSEGALPSPGAEVSNHSNALIASPLLAELIRRGIAERKGTELLDKLHSGQEVLDQLEYVDSLIAKDTKQRIANPPGLYVMYVRDNVAPPESFLSSRKRALIAQAKQQKREAAAREAQLRLDYEAFRAAETIRYIRDDIPAEEYRALFATHRLQNRQLLHHLSDEQLDELTHGTVRSELQHCGRIPLPAFQDYTNRMNRISDPSYTKIGSMT
jgi:hypothetical protein